MSSLTLPEQGLSALFGAGDEHLRLVERVFGVQVRARGSEVDVTGEPLAVATVERLFAELSDLVRQGHRLRGQDVRSAVRVLKEAPEASLLEFFLADEGLRGLLTPRTLNQRRYLQALSDHDIVFAIGPAGTGKTYLAVAVAAMALTERQVRRIVLCRPAVEAGEKLGFLPGDLAEKVNPYLRPLYDALYDLIGYDRVSRMLERGAIEVAPIAFMRGRTLNDSFVILDEAQNTTSEQMKMFLTRIGFNSRAVITGDVTQIDLPAGRASGLKEARRILDSIEGIEFVTFTERDVVRHPLVQSIVSAYDRDDRRREAKSESP